jgi:hypothetical protein
VKLSTVRKTPKIFEGRPAISLEEFVTAHFEVGRERNVARRVRRALEAELQVDLSRLHPDDTMHAILGEVDSLTVVQLTALLEESGKLSGGSPAQALGKGIDECTFRDLVEMLA